LREISDCRLYGIIDLGYVESADAVQVAEAMIQGGVDLIQLRGKEKSIEELALLAEKLHQVTSRASTPLIVNDHPEIAAKVPVEGVHVGQDDEAVAAVRNKVGRAVIVGKSTHSLDQARAAKEEGADYIGFGPIFATPTKPDYRPIGLADVGQLHLNLALPIFCIGGIKIDNLAQVLPAGAKRVVIVSGLLKAQDISNYARTCKKLLIADL
jgi:thiamine-phosphate pyrophosphorylase